MSDANSSLESQNGNGSQEETQFLQGPHHRRFEFFKAVKIFFECLRGFRALSFEGPCVTVFGSARFPQDHHYYSFAVEVGKTLAKAGFTVMTGGGPGLMEAANRGAKLAGGRSLGCNIILPREQQPNPYLDLWVEFKYFFVRKLMLAKYSVAFVAVPGGLGTLDEFFEIATLIQTGKMKNFTLVMMGREYWEPLLVFLRKMVSEKAMDQKDFERIIVSDSPDEVVSIIKKQSMEILQKREKLKRHWFFLED